MGYKKLFENDILFVEEDNDNSYNIRITCFKDFHWYGDKVLNLQNQDIEFNKKYCKSLSLINTLDWFPLVRSSLDNIDIYLSSNLSYILFEFWENGKIKNVNIYNIEEITDD